MTKSKESFSNNECNLRAIMNVLPEKQKAVLQTLISMVAPTERRHDVMMPNNPEFKSMGQLMAEADELIRRINSEAVNDMEESHRLEFEKHAQHFQKIKSEVNGKSEEKDALETSSSADGMHEAIQDIVKAFRELKKRFPY